MGSHSFLQGIFLTQGSNLGLPHCKQVLYCLSHQGSPNNVFSSVQFSHSVVSNSLRPHESQHARPPCPSPTPGVHSNSSIESVMPSSHLFLCHPFLLLPLIPPSIRVFFNESTLRMRWPKYWSFSFSISSSKEHPGLISFRIDWLDLLAVQRTLTFKYSQFSYSPIMNTQLTSIHNVHVWWPTTYIIHMVWCI